MAHSAEREIQWKYIVRTVVRKQHAVRTEYTKSKERVKRGYLSWYQGACGFIEECI